jgi:hypothetical protein
MSLPGVLVGSNAPIVFDRAAVAATLARRDVQRHFEIAGIDIARLLEPYFAQPALFGPEFDRRTLTDYNTDLFPRDEFNLSR